MSLKETIAIQFLAFHKEQLRSLPELPVAYESLSVPWEDMAPELKAPYYARADRILVCIQEEVGNLFSTQQF